MKILLAINKYVTFRGMTLQELFKNHSRTIEEHFKNSSRANKF